MLTSGAQACSIYQQRGLGHGERHVREGLSVGLHALPLSAVLLSAPLARLKAGVRESYPSLTCLPPPTLSVHAAIEDRNNRLELHSRNNQRLLDTLEGLVGCLTLSERTEEVLRYTAFNTKT